jgi:hypothetical protein
MRLRLGGVLRLLTVVGGIVFVFYVTAWMSLAYEIHRASQLATSVRAVKVGDSEDSLRPLLDRYGGFRWNEQLGALEDYNYVFEINPWRFPTFLNLRSAPIGNGLNRRFRRAIALRQWMVESEISIKQHRVVAVQEEMYVEGKTMWLGTSWRLSETPREFERDPNSEYLQWPPEPDVDFVSPAILEITEGGTEWEFWVKPTSPTIQRRVADRWNFGCFDSFRGCNSECNLLPEAAPYFKEHGELAPRGGGWDDTSRSCKHDPQEGHY